MADNADGSDKRETAEPRAGQRLANARRANDISMRDIAKRLHLDEAKVQALEDNRFDVLGAPVFAKGYLRKYAEMVNVSIDDVLTDYYRMNRAVGAPPVVGPPRKSRSRDFAPVPWVAGFLVLALAAVAAYWWMERMSTAMDTAPHKTVVPAVRQQPIDKPVAATVDPEAVAESEDSQPAETPSGEPVADASAGSSGQPTSDFADEVPPVLNSGTDALTRLRLVFSGDCWTEVTDANGRRLYFGLGTDGRTINVSGAPPLRLLLGDNDHVSLLVNGQPYPVSASELRGNTARLTIGGS
jgi:cytoskeleton protein RodZ